MRLAAVAQQSLAAIAGPATCATQPAGAPLGQQSVQGIQASVGWITPRRHVQSVKVVMSRRTTKTPPG